MATLVIRRNINFSTLTCCIKKMSLSRVVFDEHCNPYDNLGTSLNCFFISHKGATKLIDWFCPKVSIIHHI